MTNAVDSDEVLVEEASEYSADWRDDCIKHQGRVLTGVHAHWCVEWDCLPLDETCAEFGKNRTRCMCGYSADTKDD